MESDAALDAFAALAQPTRLAVFRLLVKTGSAGLTAGEIAAALDVRPNTLSANLSVLTAAGLTRSAREGRSIRYFADMSGTRALLTFLLEDCCNGAPELCQPAIDQIALCDC